MRRVATTHDSSNCEREKHDEYGDARKTRVQRRNVLRKVSRWCPEAKEEGPFPFFLSTTSTTPFSDSRFQRDSETGRGTGEPLDYECNTHGIYRVPLSRSSLPVLLLVERATGSNGFFFVISRQVIAFPAERALRPSEGKVSRPRV